MRGRAGAGGWLRLGVPRTLMLDALDADVARDSISRCRHFPLPAQRSRPSTSPSSAKLATSRQRRHFAGRGWALHRERLADASGALRPAHRQADPPRRSEERRRTKSTSCTAQQRWIGAMTAASRPSTPCSRRRSRSSRPRSPADSTTRRSSRPTRFCFATRRRSIFSTAGRVSLRASARAGCRSGSCVARRDARRPPASAALAVEDTLAPEAARDRRR